MRIAVYVTVFPALSETFVLSQLEGFLAAGHEVAIHAIRAGSEGLEQPLIKKHQLLQKTSYRGRQGSKFGRLIQTLRAGLSLGLRQPSALIRLRRAVALAPRISFAAALITAAQILRRPPADVYYAHFGPNGLVLAALKAAGLIKAPLVTVFHGYDMSQFPKDEGWDCYRLLIQEGDLMLPVSQEFSRRLQKMGCPAAKIQVHHMGIESATISYRERRRLLDEPLQLLSIARLVEKKGIEYALSALGQLRASTEIKFRYRIIGDGPLRAELEQQAEALNLSDSVEFLGWQDQEAVKAAIDQTQVLLAPSVTAANGDEEGIPVVLMEAAAGGLAIIATEHSGIPELVRDQENGLIVPERTVQDLAQAIGKVGQDPGLIVNFGRRGREIVEEEFEIQALNQELIRLLVAQADQGR